jgi:Carbohydrate/starch-binding module (family 21)
MPYTPPSQQSPVSSKVNSPVLSRSSSYVGPSALELPAGRPGASLASPTLPRSASYMSKHRRTPSISSPTANLRQYHSNTDRQSRIEKAAEASRSKDDLEMPQKSSRSLHQSPLPVTGSQLMPTGTVISPPDSSHNSSDEENSSHKRGRQLENLAELQEAIRIIEQHRSASPDRNSRSSKHMPAVDNAKVSSSHRSILRPGLSNEARKVSHSRSNTEGSVFIPKPDESPSTEDSDDEQWANPPPMVRKKSGELVKPALKPGTRSSSARRRPSSMPSTPTFPKAVHFDSHLEHVRHFLQVDKPLAVSAGSSPVEQYPTEEEYPFPSDSRSSTPPFEWDIRLPNFPSDSYERKMMPIRVEKVFLSSDNKKLIGTVAVANLAFQKYVVARFTLDYWKTTSEVTAEFNNDVRRKQQNDGHDRFNFNIKLADQANLENKTLFFCVRYNVNGQEHWDSNNGFNFQVDFNKKAVAQNGKGSYQGNKSRPANQLPRSHRPSTSPSSRPISMPASFDDFAHGFDTKYAFDVYSKKPAAQILGDSAPSTIRFKKAPSPPGDDNSQGPPVRRVNPAGQAFGNRYDFGASLTAAIQNVKTRDSVEPKFYSGGTPMEKSRPVVDASPTTISSNPSWLTNQTGAPTFSSVNTHTLEKPALDSPRNEFSGDKPMMQSSSYNELLDKYCFVRSRPNIPKKETP